MTELLRCTVCAERIPPGHSRCVRCTAQPAPANLGRRFAAYEPLRPRSPIYHFLWGIRYFVAALPYVLRTPGIKRYVAAPIGITILLLTFLIAATVTSVMWLLGPTGDGTVASVTRAIWEIVLVGLLLVAAYLLFFPLARVLLAPFADKISERVETLALGERPASQFQLPTAAADATRSLVEALKMLGLQAAVSLPLLLVPVAGPPLALAAGVFFNGLGAMDIAFGRKKMRLREKLRFAWRHLGFVLGLGTAIYAVMLVPVVDLLAIPLGAVAATAGFLRIYATAPRDEAAPQAGAKA